jgi:hypothetical protein
LKIGLYTFGITLSGMYVYFPYLNVSIGSSFVGETGFIISKLDGATLTGIYVIPFLTIGLTF